MEGYLTVAYKNVVCSRGRKFLDDDDTRLHISKTAEWLTSNKNRVGLLLYGTRGNGKTSLALAIQKVINTLFDSSYAEERHGVTTVSALDIANLAKNESAYYKRVCEAELLHIDDLGCEPASIKVYGNETSPITDMLYYRYDHQLYTVITSNLSLEDIEERYGSRLADRFYEMFDRIAFSGRSYRRM
ncbi:MAG: ATP-binding protein [Bacteroidaceae bacterium]|nr:ATP-binding protein [Bacteroidaceae bacterium]